MTLALQIAGTYTLLVLLVLVLLEARREFLEWKDEREPDYQLHYDDLFPNGHGR